MTLILSVSDYPSTTPPSATLAWTGGAPPYTVDFSHSPNMTNPYLSWPADSRLYQPVTYKLDGITRYAHVRGGGEVSNTVSFGNVVPPPPPPPPPPVPPPVKTAQIDVYSDGSIRTSDQHLSSDAWIPGINGRHVVASGFVDEAPVSV